MDKQIDGKIITACRSKDLNTQFICWQAVTRPGSHLSDRGALLRKMQRCKMCKVRFIYHLDIKHYLYIIYHLYIYISSIIYI